jgi:hypothetical protein
MQKPTMTTIIAAHMTAHTVYGMDKATLPDMHAEIKKGRVYDRYVFDEIHIQKRISVISFLSQTEAHSVSFLSFFFF